MKGINVLTRTTASLSATSNKIRQANISEVLPTIKLQLNNKSQDK